MAVTGLGVTEQQPVSSSNRGFSEITMTNLPQVFIDKIVQYKPTCGLRFGQYQMNEPCQM